MVRLLQVLLNAGHSHSGTSDGRQNLFANEANMSKTLHVLSELLDRLCNVTNVVGIELLNEPAADPGLEGFCK